MQATLFVKLALALAVVMALAVSLTVYLNIARFQETYMALVEQRLDVVLEDAHRDLLVGLDLGLAPENMETLPATLNRALATMPDLRAIHVLDCDGAAVASAGAAAEAMPWRAQLGQARWTSFDHGILAAGRALTDTLGDCAGTLVVEMDAARHQAALDALAARLWTGGALTSVLLLPVLAFLALVLRRRQAMIARLIDDLGHLRPGTTEDAGAFDVRPALTTSEARMIAAYRRARLALAGDAEQRP